MSTALESQQPRTKGVIVAFAYGFGDLEMLASEEMRDYWVHSFELPLTSIHDDMHLDRAIAKLNTLIDQVELSSGDELYLNALSDLVALYESKHIELPRASGIDVLRHLMEAHNMNQHDLVPIFGNKSTVSEVLSGKRQLALAHIKKLSQHFGVPADVFMDRETAPRK